MSAEKQTPQQDKEDYKSIVRANSLFGGVQVFKIIISILKSKVIAELLGPTGVGIQGLFQSGLTLVQGITSMGLSQSAVRDVAEADGTKDANRLNLVISVIKKIVWATGILGLLAVCIFSPILSKTSFGSYDYTIPFIYLSLTLLLDQLSAGQCVIIQGLRKYRYLAKASTYGSVFGLIVSVPLYYLFGVNGIVPTLILNSACNLVLSWFFAKKIKTENVPTPKETIIKEGRNMLIFGLAMSINTILGTLCTYALRGYIRVEGGTEMVGLYVAGFTIMETYMGMVFSAIGSDYYPRLASVNRDDARCAALMNRQGEIISLICGPLLVFALIFMPILVKLLYSSKFDDSIPYITWAVVGMMFRAGSWVISFLFIAKGDSKLFIQNEFWSKAYILILNILGCYLWGLEGLGIAYAFSYFMYFVQVFLVAHFKFGFMFSKGFAGVYAKQFGFVLAGFFIALFVAGWERYALGTTLLMFATLSSAKELEQKTGLVTAIKNKFIKN